MNRALPPKITELMYFDLCYHIRHTGGSDIIVACVTSQYIFYGIQVAVTALGESQRLSAFSCACTPPATRADGYANIQKRGRDGRCLADAVRRRRRRHRSESEAAESEDIDETPGLILKHSNAILAIYV
jgi:hypothetical protein